MRHTEVAKLLMMNGADRINPAAFDARARRVYEEALAAEAESANSFNTKNPLGNNEDEDA
jgi:hypothetical protein